MTRWCRAKANSIGPRESEEGFLAELLQTSWPSILPGKTEETEKVGPSLG